MDVKFTAVEAERIIKSISDNCNSIGENATRLLDLLEFSGMWDDRVFEEFSKNIYQICQSLEANMRKELDCIDEFQNRIDELKN